MPKYKRPRDHLLPIGMRPNQEKRKKLQRQFRDANKNGKLLSKKLTYDEKDPADKYQRVEISKLLRIVVFTILVYFINDNMKSPFGCAAKMALLSRASFNIYFGETVGRDPHDLLKVLRTAYATASGKDSIGLDPRKFTIHPIFYDLGKLRDAVKEKIGRYLQSIGRLDIRYDFNHVSVKLYGGLGLCWLTDSHTDITFEADCITPSENNSQVPNSVVAILCYGDAKFITFEQHSGTNKKTNNGTMYQFIQEHGSLFILHPDDECLKNKPYWYKHKAELICREHGYSMSLMFRVCSDTLSVNELTDRLTDPWHAGPKRQPKLDEAWEEHYKNQDQYQKQKTDKLLDIFRAFLQY